MSLLTKKKIHSEIIPSHEAVSKSIVPKVTCAFYLLFRHFLRIRQNFKICIELSSALVPMTGTTDTGSGLARYVPVQTMQASAVLTTKKPPKKKSQTRSLIEKSKLCHVD